MLPDNERTYNTGSSSTLGATFLRYLTKESNQRNDDFEKVESILKIKKRPIQFIRTLENSVFGFS